MTLERWGQGRAVHYSLVRPAQLETSSTCLEPIPPPCAAPTMSPSNAKPTRQMDPKASVLETGEMLVVAAVQGQQRTSLAQVAQSAREDTSSFFTKCTTSEATAYTMSTTMRTAMVMVEGHCMRTLAPAIGEGKKSACTLVLAGLVFLLYALHVIRPPLVAGISLAVVAGQENTSRTWLPLCTSPAAMVLRKSRILATASRPTRPPQPCARNDTANNTRLHGSHPYPCPFPVCARAGCVL